RQVRVRVIAGEGDVTAQVGNGRLTLSADSSVTGEALLTWPGARSAEGLQLQLVQATAAAEVLLEASSDATHVSTWRAAVAPSDSPRTITARAAEFASRTADTAADFANLTAVRLRVRTTGGIMVLGALGTAPLTPAGPTVTATKTAQLFT